MVLFGRFHQNMRHENMQMESPWFSRLLPSIVYTEIVSHCLPGILTSSLGSWCCAPSDLSTLRYAVTLFRPRMKPWGDLLSHCFPDPMCYVLPLRQNLPSWISWIVTTLPFSDLVLAVYRTILFLLISLNSVRFVSLFFFWLSHYFYHCLSLNLLLVPLLLKLWIWWQ